MKAKFMIIFACIVFFLTGCASLECEITRCGESCLANGCTPARCPASSCNLQQYRLQDQLCNDGAASYDSYRVIKPCIRGCNK